MLPRFPSTHPWPRSYIEGIPLRDVPGAVDVILDDLECVSKLSPH